MFIFRFNINEWGRLNAALIHLTVHYERLGRQHYDQGDVARATSYAALVQETEALRTRLMSLTPVD